MEEERKKETGPEEVFGDYITPQNEPEQPSSVTPGPPGNRNIDIQKAFSGNLSSKLEILAEAVEEIDQLIAIRRALSKVIQERIDKEIFNSESLLLQVRPWQLGHSNSIEMRRLGLEKEILSLKKEQRSEEVREWEHIASLKKLKRQFLIEYQNLLNTKKALEDSAP